MSAGTFLGYQGNFSGTPGNPTGVHLHFSIVMDDGEGGFLNELKIRNTLDPSPYFNPGFEQRGQSRGYSSLFAALNRQWKGFNRIINAVWVDDLVRNGVTDGINFKPYLS